MKKLRLSLLLLLVLLAMALPVHADTGPKPSVVIQVVGMPEEPCYITLLSERGSTGPHTSMKQTEPPSDMVITWGDPTPRYSRSDPDYPIWQKFREYEQEDDFFFLQTFELLPESGQYRWGYYPPSTFKALLYFPEQDAFAVSSVYTRYAFHSYYTLDLTGAEPASGGTASPLTLRESYDHGWELAALAFRVILTLLLELGIAWVMKLRAKSQLLYITLVNLLTQSGLNAALYLQAYRNGPSDLIITFVLLEICITAVEFLLYLLIPGWRDHSLRERAVRSWNYALPANLCSLMAGGVLALFLPSFF